MDTSRLAFPKGRPRALDKAVRRKALEAFDTRESAKVRVRSGGLCEAQEEFRGHWTRCGRHAMHVHHLLGGIGVRGVGESALASQKVHVCAVCHRLIHNHILRSLGGVRFERVT
jgi:predicted HNH restriction endonuclease